MEAYKLLSELKSHRLDVQVIDGNLYISPRANITRNLRQAIKKNKTHLAYFIEAYEERAAIMEFSAGPLYIQKFSGLKFLGYF